MNTPKEEAWEIFNSMKGFRVKFSHAKKCAIKTVLLLHKHCEKESKTYWNEVEKELNKIQTL